MNESSENIAYCDGMNRYTITASIATDVEKFLSGDDEALGRIIDMEGISKNDMEKAADDQ